MKLFVVLCIVIAPILGQMKKYVTSDFTYTVVNGKCVDRTQFPWQVSIQASSNRESVPIRCSGSLISSNRVLTAAQCIHNFILFKVRVGNINITPPVFEQTISHRNTVIHPRYNSTNYNNDIAIITLKYDVPFSSMLQPIRLPRRSQSGIDTFSNRLASVGGWDRSSDHSMLNVTNRKCKLSYRIDVVTNRTVCGHGIVTSCPCVGDAGSPLILTDIDGGATQIGIFSFIPHNGCAKDYPAGFTYTAAYLDWIGNHTGIPIIN